MLNLFNLFFIGNLLYVQYVYAPIIKLLSHRSGFVAISQLGYIIKAGFHCPYKIRPEYNPLRNIKAQYRVTSREKNLENRDVVISKVPGYNPAQFDFMGMLKSKTSSTCQLLWVVGCNVNFQIVTPLVKHGMYKTMVMFAFGSGTCSFHPNLASVSWLFIGQIVHWLYCLDLCLGNGLVI